mgnify:CR=1 FL=1
MTTTDLVTVPREPTDEMIRAGVAARWFVDNDEGKPANVRNSWEAMIAAAPPAASVRAKEVTNLEIATAFHEAYERLAPRYGYETRPESRKPFSDLPNELKLLMVAVVREVRTLLAPAVDERAASSEHTHTDACWEPDSGCDMGRSEEHARVASSEAAVALLRKAVSHIAALNGTLQDCADLGMTIAVCGTEYDDAEARDFLNQFGGSNV